MAAEYDVVIIGGGQAGVPLANALAKAGKTVALFERKDLGGSCVNFGCTPTKAAITSARIAHLARRGQEFGLHIPTVEVNFAQVLERARNIALTSRHSLDASFADAGNPQLVREHARLDGQEGGFFSRSGRRTTIPCETDRAEYRHAHPDSQYFWTKRN